MSTYDTQIPGASQYAGAALLAKRAYDNAVASVTQRRQGTLTQYGYKGTVGANGQLTNFAVDPYNPYGQFQQLRRGNAQASSDLFSADAERGIGTSGGLALQDQENLRYGEHAADAALGQGLSNDLSGYQGELNQAAYSRDAALYEAELAAAQAAIANGDFNPAAYGDGGGGGGGSSTDPNSTTGGIDPSTIWGSGNVGGAVRYLDKLMQRPRGYWQGQNGKNVWHQAPTVAQVMKKPLPKNFFSAAAKAAPKAAPKKTAPNTFNTRVPRR